MGKKKKTNIGSHFPSIFIFLSTIFFYHHLIVTPFSTALPKRRYLFPFFFFRPLMGISPLQCNSTIISSKWYDSNHDQFFNRFLFNCMLRRVFLVFTDSPRFRSSLVLATNLAHSMHLTRPLSMIQSRTHV